MTDKHDTQITKDNPRKKQRLGMISKEKILEGLNMFDCTIFALISDGNKDELMFGLHEISLIYRFIIILDIKRRLNKK